MAEPALSPEMEVSAEHDGRILTGVGVDVADLEATMAREAPAETEPDPKPATEDAPPDAPAAQTDRNPDGTFKKAAKGRARFSELTSERDEARMAAEAAQRERDELRARLEALEKGQKPAASDAKPEQPREPEPTRPKPVWDDAKYASYEDFIDDRAAWIAEQREAAMFPRLAAALAEREQRAARATVARERGRAAYADWDTVMAGPGAKADIFSPAHLDAIFQAPNSEHVQYALASDAALAARVAKMPVGVELGYIFAGLSSSSPRERVASPASTPPAPTSRASAPYQPVGAATKTASPSLSDLADHGDDYDSSGYRERRKQELRASGR